MTDFELNVKEEGFYNGKPCEDFLIHLKQYHPGVPGYVLKYDYYITFKGKEITIEDYIIRANLDEVWIKPGRILVPDRVRKTSATLTVTATYKKDENYKTTLKIKLRKYELTLEDNFETYNTELWSGVPYGAKTDKSITPVKDNYVRDGKLCLDFVKLDKPIIKDGKEYWYTDTGVYTTGKFSQKYGLFTSSMCVPSIPQGIFSAFWLMPEGKYRDEYFFKRTDTGDDFHGCSEIDIMEIFHQPDTMGSFHTEHYWEPNSGMEGSNTKSSLHNEYGYEIPGYKDNSYHEYSCVWNEYGIYYYVDGELARCNTNIAPVDDVKAAYVFFSCYIGPKDSTSWFGEVDDKDLPQTTYVDWLKVYK